MLKTLSALFILSIASINSTQANEVLLTVIVKGDEKIEFTRRQLVEMPVTEFRTSTVWTKGVIEFAGVSLSEFVSALDIKAKVISAVALNDYAVEIPLADAVEGGPIIAYLMNGEIMSPRDKGPLWLVYPFDDKSEYKTETFYSRSIWQLDRLAIDN